MTNDLFKSGQKVVKYFECIIHVLKFGEFPLFYCRSSSDGTTLFYN